MCYSGFTVSMKTNGTMIDCGMLFVLVTQYRSLIPRPQTPREIWIWAEANSNYNTIMPCMASNLYRYQYRPPGCYLYFGHCCCHFVSLSAFSGGDTIHISALSLRIGLGELDGDYTIHLLHHLRVGFPYRLSLSFDLAVAGWSCGCVSGLD